MLTDPCLLENFNLSQIYVDLSILKSFDERPDCPLYWYKEAEFIIDPKAIIDMYLINGEELPQGLAYKLTKLYNKKVLFKRIEKWSKNPCKFAAAPGHFSIFIENEHGEWVYPS